MHEVKSIPIPTTSSGVARALRSTSGTVGLDRRDVVGGILQRPVRRKSDVLVRGRQALVDHAVGVGVDGSRHLLAGRDIDEDGAPTLGPEIDPDRVPHDRGRCP